MRVGNGTYLGFERNMPFNSKGAIPFQQRSLGANFTSAIPKLPSPKARPLPQLNQTLNVHAQSSANRNYLVLPSFRVDDIGHARGGNSMNVDTRLNQDSVDKFASINLNSTDDGSPQIKGH